MTDDANNITDERRQELKDLHDKYRPLFRRQPNYIGSATGLLRDEEADDWLDRIGLKVYVTKKVDQSTLPEADRIPACLEGVPVQILVEEIPEPS